jgi:hypothetical protein
MTDLIVRPYVESDHALWDRYCDQSIQGTFIQKRRYLNYHGKKFVDLSVFIEAKGETVGFLSAAQSPHSPQTVISHPGITYGGVVHCGYLRGERMLRALEAICNYYREIGLKKLIYKCTPNIYFKVPAHDDRYALFRLNAKLIRCDLSVSVQLNRRLSVSKRRKRGFKRASKSGIQLCWSNTKLPDFYNILRANLTRKHEVKPVHTLDELKLLMAKFPKNIFCVTALNDENVVAGTLLYATSNVYHCQYIASTDMGNNLSALDFVFEKLIGHASDKGIDFFDFGISNEEEGQHLNSGLYDFKSEFGGAGNIHEFYELDIG